MLWDTKILKTNYLKNDFNNVQGLRSNNLMNTRNNYPDRLQNSRKNSKK